MSKRNYDILLKMLNEKYGLFTECDNSSNIDDIVKCVEKDEVNNEKVYILHYVAKDFINDLFTIGEILYFIHFMSERDKVNYQVYFKYLFLNDNGYQESYVDDIANEILFDVITCDEIHIEFLKESRKVNVNLVNF